jgi:ABC-2 type transport system permease protein
MTGRFTLLYRLQLRLLVTRGRLALLGLLSVLGLVLAFVVRNESDLGDASFSFVSNYALGGLVPVTALVLGAASLGDPAEDATLVHLWLRPVSRWHLAVSAWAASMTLCIPVAVIPMTIAAGICGVGTSFTVGTLVSSLLGTAAYAAVFTAFGIHVARALPWGLAYVLIWEGAIASAGAGLARLSIRGYTRSLLQTFAEDVDVVRYSVSRPVALLVLPFVTVAGIALTRRRLDTTDIA